MLMAAALLWLRGSRVSPAILLGLTCWLKPQMILFVLWGLLRSQWRFTTSLVLTFLAGVLLSIGIFGWHNSVEYIQVLRYLGQRGDSMFWNQSLNGLLHRLMHMGSPVTSFYGYPPFNRTIYLATILSSATMLLLALAVPVFRRMTATTADFLIYAMACTMASPIVWQHHYGVFFHGVSAVDSACPAISADVNRSCADLSADDRYLGPAHPAHVHSLVSSPIPRLFWRPCVVSLYTVPRTI